MLELPALRCTRRSDVKARSVLISVSLIAVASACARYELKPDYETPACAGYRRPVSKIVTDSSAAATPDDLVTLRIVDARDLTPVEGATLPGPIEPRVVAAWL